MTEGNQTAEQRMTKAQKMAREYLNKHKIEQMIGDMINTIVHAKSEVPIIFMIKYLSNFYTQKELKEYGVSVEGELPRRLPIFTFGSLGQECKSLLKKTMTQKIWMELRSAKTSMGGRLANCVLPSVEDPDTPIGIVACDAEAYHKFKTLFDPIVSQLHPAYNLESPSFRHDYGLGMIDWSGIKLRPDVLQSVEVSGVRNLTEFPFLSMMDSHQKFSLDNKLTEYMIDQYYDGKFHMLELGEEQEARLREKGLLFLGGARGGMPKSGGPRDSLVSAMKWKEGSFIYYKSDLSAAMWVNQDDHLKVIAKHSGVCDPQSAFENVLFRLQAIGEKFSVAESKTLGSLTSCPGNLGTGLQAKITVELKYVEGDLGADPEIANLLTTHKLDLKSMGGKAYSVEIGESLGVDITEASAVGGIVECLGLIMRKEEKAFHNYEDKLLQESLPKKPYLDETNTSLVKSFLTEEVWEVLRKGVTSYKTHIGEVIAPATQNNKLGLIALDPECYEVFAPIFTPIISSYHEDFEGGNGEIDSVENMEEFMKEMKEVVSEIPVECISEAFIMNELNLKDHAFPVGLTPQEKQAINQELMEMLGDPSNPDVQMVAASGCEWLGEKMFFKEIKSKQEGVPQLNMEEMLGVESECKVLTEGNRVGLLNFNNHLCLVQSLGGDDLLSLLESALTAYEKLTGRDTLRNKWAFDGKLGFLNSLPCDLGNGFTFKIGVRGGVVGQAGAPGRVNLSVEEEEGVVWVTGKYKYCSVHSVVRDVLTVVREICQKSKGGEQEEVPMVEGEGVGEGVEKGEEVPMEVPVEVPVEVPMEEVQPPTQEVPVPESDPVPAGGEVEVEKGVEEEKGEKGEEGMREEPPVEGEGEDPPLSAPVPMEETPAEPSHHSEPPAEQSHHSEPPAEHSAPAEHSQSHHSEHPVEGGKSEDNVPPPPEPVSQLPIEDPKPEEEVDVAPMKEGEEAKPPVEPEPIVVNPPLDPPVPQEGDVLAGEGGVQQ